MYKPVFPYLGNQAIITSGRVVIHSNDDFIFLFGKKGVAVSSPATFTVDANEKTIIASPEIELGYEAKIKGDQLMLGNKTLNQLNILLDQLSALSSALSKLTEKEMVKALPSIAKESIVLENTCKTVKDQLKNFCLSKTTYTL